jgi:hypothetical protein
MPGGKLHIQYDGKEARAQFRITWEGAKLFPALVATDKPNLQSAPAGTLVIEYVVGPEEYLMFPNAITRTVSVDLKPNETREVTLHDG